MRSLHYPLRTILAYRDRPVVGRATFLPHVFDAGVSAGRAIILHAGGLPDERASPPPPTTASPSTGG